MIKERVPFLRSDRGRLVTICLLIGAAILGGTLVGHRAYLSDYRLNDSLDARHYVQLGHNLLVEGHYSRTDGPPYPPDYLRTPIYPVVAGGLDLMFGAVGIYLFQIGLHLALVWMIYGLGRSYFGERVAFWVALFPAVDLMYAVYNFNALTEPLFVTWTFAGLAVLLPRLVPPPGHEETAPAGGWRRDLLGGLLLALATMTRPAGLYLPVLAAAMALWFVGRRRGVRPAMRVAALILIPSVILVGGWIGRNQRLFGVAKISIVDAVGTVFMAGAGAYQVHHDISRPEAQEMIVDEFEIPTLQQALNPWLLDRPVREIDASLRAAGPEVLRKYPRDLVVSSVVGVIKGTLSHNVNELETLLGLEWNAPGGGRLARLRPDAWRTLIGNPPVLSAVFFWQLFHSLALVVGALVGVVLLLRSPRDRQVACVLLVVLAYFGAGMALFGIDAYYRSRIPLLPYLSVLAGVGIGRGFVGGLLHKRWSR